MSFLSRWEAPLLRALAARLPAKITPNHLTLIGCFGACIVLAAGFAARFDCTFLWLSNLGLVIHWLGDSLDGTLARERRIERPRFGFFIDQMTDVITNLLIALGIAAAGYARLDVTLLVLVAYQMLSAYSLIQSATTGNFLVSINGFGPTEMRICIIALSSFVWLLGAPKVQAFGIDITWADGVLMVSFVVMLCLFAHGFVHDARRLNAEEPPHEAP